MKTQHTPGPWRVQADPLMPKRHPYHDSRYITTHHDLETWRSPVAEGHGDDMCGFAKDDGSAAIICTMRDGEHQKANAQLIALAPTLLAQRNELREALKECAEALMDHVRVESIKSGLPVETICPCKTTTLLKARTALAKAQEAGL